MRFGCLLLGVMVVALGAHGGLADTHAPQPEPATAAPAPGAAAPAVYNGITADELADVMRNAGYRAQIETPDGSNPEIASSTSGLTFWVWLANCSQETPRRCEDFQIYAILTPDDSVGLDVVNAFNNGQRFVHADIASDGRVWVRYDVVTTGGVTADNLQEHFRWWDIQLGKFLRHINW